MNEQQQLRTQAYSRIKDRSEIIFSRFREQNKDINAFELMGMCLLFVASILPSLMKEETQYYGTIVRKYIDLDIESNKDKIELFDANGVKRTTFSDRLLK